MLKGKLLYRLFRLKKTFPNSFPFTALHNNFLLCSLDEIFAELFHSSYDFFSSRGTDSPIGTV